MAIEKPKSTLNSRQINISIFITRLLLMAISIGALGRVGFNVLQRLAG